MAFDLLWLLLPVAAASGWFAARRGAKRAPARPDGGYFEGLNFLLNEQPDRAIEVFTRMVEVDSETVEVHLALGNLFRRRGEVDRAIRIHQNLIARPSLTRTQRAGALLELGEDYLRSGVLDRAENLFRELADTGLHTAAALRRLVDIYEHEKEWEAAIGAARRLEAANGGVQRAAIAQYHCELAEIARAAGRHDDALRSVRRALSHDRRCARASILEGRLEMERGRYRSAAESLMRVDEQAPEYLAEVIEPLGECFRRLGRPERLEAFLERVLARHPETSAIIALAELRGRRSGAAEAARFLAEALERNPSLLGIQRLVRWYRSHAHGECERELSTVGECMERLFEDVPAYYCTHCGFSGRTLHWQCPGCRRWGSVKPLHGMSVNAFLASMSGRLQTSGRPADAEGRR